MRRNLALNGSLILLCLGTPSWAHGQRAIFLLRHAERAEYESRDGVFSEAGEARARNLADLLRDAGVKAIYTSEYTRTIQTAEPLAHALQITPTAVGDEDLEDHIATTLRLVHASAPDDVVVIVGHGDTVPLLLEALGHPEEVTIGEREHDDLFLMVPRSNGSPIVVRLNY